MVLLAATSRAAVGVYLLDENFNSMTSGFFLVMLVLSSVGLMVGGVGVVAGTVYRIRGKGETSGGIAYASFTVAS